jgi:hypothetical protein
MVGWCFVMERRPTVNRPAVDRPSVGIGVGTAGIEPATPCV